MLEKDDNMSDNFGLYLDKKSILNKQDINKNYSNSIVKGLDTKNCIKDSILRGISQDEVYTSKLSSSLREVRFDKYEFPTSKP